MRPANELARGGFFPVPHRHVFYSELRWGQLPSGRVEVFPMGGVACCLQTSLVEVSEQNRKRAKCKMVC